ncbi:G2/mitotic-specific cyclin [Pseudogymnoascus australis]
MPPARALRTRVATNENDENVGTTRLTRAKAAALSVDDLSSAAQKPLQSKKSGLQINQPLQRKRAALGDVSNVTKGDGAAEGKKPLGKSGLVSKAAQPTGIQKVSRANSTRPALGSKDNNKKSAVELKRTASGSGVLGGGVTKKRQTTSSTSSLSVKESVTEDEEPARKKVHTRVEKRVAPEVMSENKVEKVAVEAIKEPEVEDQVLDLDAEDIDDPLMVAEYVHEIFDYLKELEVATMPNPVYMKHQEDLEWKMRGILVDWLIEVHTRFHLLPETLFLAVNILDRFLSAKVVQLDRLQLVGVTAMFIASKYEEVLSPHVQNFRHVADDGFTEAEILSAERYVLSALNYDLSYPNPMNFLRRISKADNYDIETRTLGKYLMEISLLDHRFMGYLPSEIAASSMYLARKILNKGPWDATIAHYAGYSEEQIEPIFILMVDYLARPVTHEAFFKKYASKKFMKASIHSRQWSKKHAEELGIEISQPLDSVSQ